MVVMSENSSDILYPSYAIEESHPGHLGGRAWCVGLETMDPSTALILEIGCASGGNVLPLASEFPEATIIACDPSAQEIALARARATEAQLTNIEFHHCGVAELPQALGPFDYIICHGIYSWVPDQVREDIGATLRSRLSKNGLAFVSYNCLPGFHIRGMWREMIAEHCKGIDDPTMLVPKAIEALQLVLAGASGANPAYAHLLEEELMILQDAGPGYVLQEHFAPDNKSFYIHEFLQEMEAKGLFYVGDGDPTSDTLSNLNPEVARRLRDISAIDRLKYRDYMTGCTFRMSILSREKSTKIRADFEKLHAGIRHRQVLEHFDTLTDDTAKALLDAALRHWPNTLHVPRLIEAAELQNISPDTIANTLVDLQNSGFLRLRTTPVEATMSPSDTKTLSRFTELEATWGPTITNPWHDSIPFDESAEADAN